MKAIVFFIISLALAKACDFLTMTGIPDVIRGYAVAIVDSDDNQEESDCYIDSDRLGKKITIFYGAVQNLSSDTMVDPLKYSNQLLVDFSN
jgi:hypothetical protein